MALFWRKESKLKKKNHYNVSYTRSQLLRNFNKKFRRKSFFLNGLMFSQSPKKLNKKHLISCHIFISNFEAALCTHNCDLPILT